ncbi:MAG: sigma-54-dependent Fis family transcriptional regulator [Candidatus Scalindua sp.]|nr:sigma-54-dependent Fis family transcriptional regulator [Candidatus Scalindua sp.]
MLKQSKHKILVVDDEEALRYTIETFLLREGYDVDTAGSYKESLGKLSEARFDLILTDIMLGDGTGIDILQEVNRRNLLCPVILITGHPNIETASDAVRDGAHDYVAKPVRKDVLLQKVEMTLRHKEIIDENREYQSTLDAIFRSVKDAIVTVDKELIVLETNDAVKDICGFLPEEIKGKPFNSLQLHCRGECVNALVETIKTKKSVETYRIECKHQQRPNGVVSISTFPLKNPQEDTYGCVMVLKDETRLAGLERVMHERTQFYNIIGSSRKMQNIYSLIENLSSVQTTVLITGESGTGKELIADALHYHGECRDKPLVEVNCAALSDELLESELFGHAKGAFTGATTDRVGRFQKADGGTIFLDEIGEISNKLQLRLLRVLQEGEFERVGDSDQIKVNVRVIAATNNELHKMVSAGSFREDLYYRLNVVQLTLPPLRERREDIPAMLDHFLNGFNKKLNKNVTAISEDVQRRFMSYSWPGNIRELQNTLEFAVVLCHGSTITIRDLSPEFIDRNEAVLDPADKNEDERQAIIRALKETGWNKAKASRLLGIDRKTIYTKIARYNIVEDGA